MSKPVDLKKLDAEYRAWIQRQASCVSRRFSEYVNGEGRCVAAHVRRARDSGVAWKPLFRAIPLTDAEHRLTHQHGEGRLYSPDWFSQKVDEYFERWLEIMPHGTREAIDAAQKIGPRGS